MRPERPRREHARPPSSALLVAPLFPFPYPDWMSERGVLVALRMQREHPRGLGLPDALFAWERLARGRVGSGPSRARDCCGDVGELHEVLRTALRTLPARDARRLRRRLRAVPHRRPPPLPWDGGTWVAHTPLEDPTGT